MLSQPEVHRSERNNPEAMKLALAERLVAQALTIKKCTVGDTDSICKAIKDSLELLEKLSAQAKV